MRVIPPKVSHLDPILQHLLKHVVTLKEDEVKQANLDLQNVVLDAIQNEMKRIDETFRTVYRGLHYVGSYYENLKVGHPAEFDINLELHLPINESHIEIQTNEAEPGFVKIRVTPTFHTHTSAAVRRKIESWLQYGYLCRDKIIYWLQGIVERVIRTVQWPENVKVSSRTRGPAVTLIIRVGANEFEVDLVPVFLFGSNRLPPQPTRQLSDLPGHVSTHLKWCAVPKSPRKDSFSTYEWRMSFYMYEKEMMINKGNMKPVLKLIKLLRDKENWAKLSSYYIKTIFMWEQVMLGSDTNFWRNGLGYLFMHMLGKLEDYLQAGKIPFFWDVRNNLISHLGQAQILNIHSRVIRVRRQLELALSEPDRNLSSVVYGLFTVEPAASVIRVEEGWQQVL